MLSIHRQENVDLPEGSKKYSTAWLQCARGLMVSTHPRTKVRLEALAREDLAGLTFHEPFGYLDYNKLQLGSKCVISDSGTISEESSLMSFSAVILRDSMEMPEALEAGSIIMTGLNADNLVRPISLELSRASEISWHESYALTSFSNEVLKYLFSTCSLHRKWKNLG